MTEGMEDPRKRGEVAEITHLREVNTEMYEALTPFARNYFECDGADNEAVELFYGEDESWHIGTITLGDLRRALAAVRKARGETK